jgi:hypothetical protein
VSRSGPDRLATSSGRQFVLCFVGADALSTNRPPSSSGLGHRPFTAAARVRIPLGVLDRRSRQKSPGHDDRSRCRTMPQGCFRSGRTRSSSRQGQVRPPTDGEVFGQGGRHRLRVVCTCPGLGDESGGHTGTGRPGAPASARGIGARNGNVGSMSTIERRSERIRLGHRGAPGADRVGVRRSVPGPPAQVRALSP